MTCSRIVFTTLSIPFALAAGYTQIYTGTTPYNHVVGSKVASPYPSGTIASTLNFLQPNPNSQNGDDLDPECVGMVSNGSGGNVAGIVSESLCDPLDAMKVYPLSAGAQHNPWNTNQRFDTWLLCDQSQDQCLQVAGWNGYQNIISHNVGWGNTYDESKTNPANWFVFRYPKGDVIEAANYEFVEYGMNVWICAQQNMNACLGKVEVAKTGEWELQFFDVSQAPNGNYDFQFGQDEIAGHWAYLTELDIAATEFQFQAGANKTDSQTMTKTWSSTTTNTAKAGVVVTDGDAAGSASDTLVTSASSSLTETDSQYWSVNASFTVTKNYPSYSSNPTYPRSVWQWYVKTVSY